MKNILKFLYCFPPHLSQDSTKDLHLLGGHPYCGGRSPGRVTEQWQSDTQAQANLRRQDQRRSSAGHATVKDTEIPTEKTIVNDVRETLAHRKAGKSKEGEAPPPSFYPGWDPVSVFFLLCKMGGGVFVVISSETLAATEYAQGKEENHWGGGVQTEWSEGHLLAWQELLSNFSLLQPPNRIVSSLI